jgi:hypothetical protein
MNLRRPPRRWTLADLRFGISDEAFVTIDIGAART